MSNWIDMAACCCKVKAGDGEDDVKELIDLELHCSLPGEDAKDEVRTRQIWLIIAVRAKSVMAKMISRNWLVWNFAVLCQVTMWKMKSALDRFGCSLLQGLSWWWWGWYQEIDWFGTSLFCVRRWSERWSPHWTDLVTPWSFWIINRRQGWTSCNDRIENWGLWW